jgi:hypothetical protein
MKALLGLSRNKFMRFYGLVERLASWCSWRCPLASFILVIAAHLHSASWWQKACYTLITALVALLFSSYGLCAALSSVDVHIVHKRINGLLEKIGLVSGLVGGTALIAIGLVGAWVFFKSAVLGR